MVESAPRLDVVAVMPTVPPSSADEWTAKIEDKQKQQEGPSPAVHGGPGPSSRLSGTKPPALYDFIGMPDPPRGVTPFKPTSGRTCACLDWFFAAVFVANVVGMGAAAFYWGYDAVFDGDKSTNALLSPQHARLILKLGTVLAVGAFILALLFAKQLTASPRDVALCGLGLSIGGTIMISVFGFTSGQLLFGVGGIVVALFCLLNSRSIVPRFGFVVANFRVAGAALARHQGVYLVAFVSSVIQIVWIVLCAVAFLGIASQLKAARDADYWTHYQPDNAPCTTDTECASNYCLVGFTRTTRECVPTTTTTVTPTLKPSGALCTTDNECVGGLCVSIITNAPRRCIGLSAGTKAVGASCNLGSECVSRVCKQITTRSSSKCANPTGASYLPGPSARDYTILTLVGVGSYWSLLVFKNVVQTTTAGVVAAFWYGTDADGATSKALRRSLTTSLGAVSVGSFLLATVVAALQTIKQSGESFLGTCAAKIFEELQPLLQYFNRWSLVYVSIYDHTFVQASFSVNELFALRGFSLIISADLEGRIMYFAAMAVASVCCLLSVPIASLIGTDSTSDLDVIQQIVGIVAGLGIALTPLAVVDSAVATVYVCFAEDPAALELSHPDLHRLLVKEWHGLHPDAMVQGGYMYKAQVAPLQEEDELDESPASSSETPNESAPTPVDPIAPPTGEQTTSDIEVEMTEGPDTEK